MQGQSRHDSRFATFSPTLARLLTAPEKIQPTASISPINATSFLSQVIKFNILISYFIYLIELYFL